jgi:hypothetical protein
MIYVKRMLVGVLGLFTLVVVILCTEFVAAGIWIWAHGGNDSVFVTFSNRSPFVCVFALFVFGCGFYWEYRRLTR